MSTVYIHLVVALIESRTLNKTSSRQYLIYIDASIEGRSCESYTFQEVIRRRLMKLFL